MNYQITSVIQAYKNKIPSLQQLFIGIALSTSKIIIKNDGSSTKNTPWKILQQTKDPTFLPRGVLNILKKQTATFLRNELTFQPLGIWEVLANG